MPNWTKEQQEAIDKEGTNIIVSAGAGSGKTTVLTARVIRKLKDGIDINKFLILTFTNEAAGEMKAKIRKAIKKEPTLKKQLDYLDGAYITTFDSYAFSIVRKYNYALNVSKNIKIIDQSIINIIRKQFLEDIFENYYQKRDKKFVKLISDFCTKDDKEIKKAILKLSSKIELKIDKEEYLNNYIEENYNESYIEELVNSYEELLLSKVEEIKAILEIIRIKEDNDFYEKISLALEKLTTATNYEQIKENLQVKLPTLKAASLVKEEKEAINKLIKEIDSLTIYDDKNEIKETYLSTKSFVEVIIEIIKELDKKVLDYKNSKDCYEFTDISKMAIKIVKENKEIKDEIRSFYNEIMVDEYQDTSDLQEAFIKEIENNNVYMVGDIKQSIYRFRNANPSIFKNKYDNYSKNLGGIKIDLLKNFRSRNEVLDNINIIFNKVMDDNIGGADYISSHQMIFGNTSYIEEGKTSQDYNLEIINYDNDDPTYKKEEKEIFIIANDIKTKIKNKYQIFDKDEKILRNATYNDFCIILDRGTDFETYRKIFENIGIPLSIYQDEDLTASYDILIIKNILKLIIKINKKEYDQEFRYLFTSISRSNLFSKTDEEIFECFINNSFYQTEVFTKCSKIANNIAIKTPSIIINEIIDSFSITEKTILTGDMEKSIIRVEYLQKIAKSLDDLGFTIEMLKDYLEEMISSDNEIKYKLSTKTGDTVRLMNIHKSKGLEFNICYYAGLYKPFNTSDIKERFSFDNKYGIITPYFKEGIGEIITKHLSKQEYNKEEISEKIRLFYVAMTRCKEKMILITSLKEDYIELKDIVDNKIRLNYHSFLDILNSVKEELTSYIKNIDLETIYMTKDYNNIKSFNYKDFIEPTKEKISKIKLDIDTNEIEEKHFSKTINKLITKEEKDNMEFGTKMHYLFEITDFNNINNLEPFYKEKIEKFLNKKELNDINKAKIYKEYEFMYEENNTIYTGIIDLMLEYKNDIKIIDYKLNSIKDDAYIKQLNGYKKYIETLTNKKVSIYLYSILSDELKEL